MSQQEEYMILQAENPDKEINIKDFYCRGEYMKVWITKPKWAECKNQCDMCKSLLNKDTKNN